MSVVDSIVDFAASNPGSAVQIIFSGVLALATIAYTVATFLQISEMKTDREVRNRPIVKPTIESKYGRSHFFAVENSGEGAAYDVVAKWWSDEDDKNTWKIPLLSPGERRTFPLPFGDGDETIVTSDQIEDVAGGDATIEFRACYDDSLGNSYSPDDHPDVATASIDVLDTIETRREASEYVEDDHIKKIADEMDEVTKQLERIQKSVKMDHLDGRARLDIHREVLETVREEGTITFGELRSQVGTDPPVLVDLLRQMMLSGEVEYDQEEAGGFVMGGMDVEIEYVGDARSV
ncbi:hypothetical protein [Halosimplex halobium]|uniref:hypothetical protein n=1 Tax=Halosimplex halobium TaxID=3396618 RepID=UPI003F56EC27